MAFFSKRFTGGGEVLSRDEARDKMGTGIE
jgi:hypothetical protein